MEIFKSFSNKVFLKLINSLLSKLGYSIISKKPKIEYLLSGRWVKNINPDIIIDVGANEGQFLTLARKYFKDTMFLVFEPNPNCFLKLKSKFNNNNITLFNLGIANKKGFMNLNINEFSPASSFLEMRPDQKQFFNTPNIDNKVKVKVETLDNICKEYQFNKAMLKIDVQGLELNVLKGSITLLKRTSIIIIEVGFKMFYENQPSFKDINDFLYEHCFEFKGVADQLTAGDYDEPVQIDAIYIKTSL